MQTEIRDQKPYILVSAYSYAPRQGSESGTGWATVLTLTKEYRVIVVCVGHYKRHFIETDFEYLKSLGVKVIFFEDNKHTWILRLPGMFWHKIYYTFWQKAARELFTGLIEEYRPVVLQHINWGTGRAISGLVGLGVPMVFGPIGGFESGCSQLDRGLGVRHFLSEKFRRFHIKHSLRSAHLREMYGQVDLVLACTHESASCVIRLGAKKIQIMTNAGISEEMVSNIKQLRKKSNITSESSLQLLFASRLVGWKGEELAIRAIGNLKGQAVNLTVLGSGPNLPRCLRLAKELGVLNQIRFISFLPKWDDVWNLYATSDVFLFPSLHDSGGTSVLEAMAAELPVICLDLGGPAEFINEECGKKIARGTVEEVVTRMSDAISELLLDKEKCEALGKAGERRCREHFTWEARGSKLLMQIRSAWEKP